MTIRSRILAVNLAVVALSLAPSVYAVLCLSAVGERTRVSLESGLGTIRAIDRLRSEFEELQQLIRISGAFSGDPEVQQKIDSTLAAARETYARLKPRLEQIGAPVPVTLERLLDNPPAATAAPPGHEAGSGAPADASGPSRTAQSSDASRTTGSAGSAADFRSGRDENGTGSAATDAAAEPRSAGADGDGAGRGASASIRMSDPAEPDGTGSGHGTAGEGAGSAGVSWSEDDAHGVRVAISAADQFTRRHLIEETAEIKSDAERAATLGIGALLLTAPIALLSTFVVVRGILRPLDRLSAGTTAVASGRFGIELPVRGKDELSELARAFNTMSTSLAVLDRMKADFINVVAHELKTPLACVKGYAGALRASLPPELHGGEIRGYLDRIDREADLLSRRVSELLTFGVIEAGQLQLEPREVMTEGFLVMVGDAVRPIAAERGVDFAVEIGRDVPPTFIGDPDRLNQVVLNLLDNAFKFTPKGGRIRLAGARENGAIVIEVRDSGSGIAPEQLGTIFQKYARARSSEGGGRGGTGLGLAIARGIVLAHGGMIEAWSKTGEGSTFRVRLPLAGNPARGKEVA